MTRDRLPDPGREKTGRRPLRIVALFVLAGLFLTAALIWNLRAGRAKPRNVILIIGDSLRVDRLGAYGSNKGLTPFLDQLAAESIVYDRAYAASSWTIPSVATLFLAAFPSEHRVSRFFAKIPPEAVTLAEILQGHGFVTVSFTANSVTQPKSGFDQGFDRWEIVDKEKQSLTSPKSDGKAVNKTILAWRQEADPQKPFFGYFHFMDTHTPYRLHAGITAPPPAGLETSDFDLNLRVGTAAWNKNEEVWRKRWAFTPPEVQRLQDLYDGEVRYFDACLQELFTELEQRGDLAQTLVIVTADHGEDFGEHGVYGHGTSLFQSAIQVPLIVRFPGQRGGKRIATPIQLGGLGPAVLAALGIEIPPQFRIPPIPFDDELSPPSGAYAYSELAESQMRVRLHGAAIVAAEAKLLVKADGDVESYDLQTDPLERRSLTRPNNTLTDALAKTRAGLKEGATATEDVPIDELTRQRLRDLGYFPHAE